MCKILIGCCMFLPSPMFDWFIFTLFFYFLLFSSPFLFSFGFLCGEEKTPPFPSPLLSLCLCFPLFYFSLKFPLFLLSVFFFFAAFHQTQRGVLLFLCFLRSVKKLVGINGNSGDGLLLMEEQSFYFASL